MASWVTDRNWLEDAEYGTIVCGYGSPDVEAQRSTVFDVLRMWWDLRTDQGLTANQLSNLHVNACPLDWAPADTTLFDQLDRPFTRLLTSSENLGLDTELIAEESHVLH